MEGIVYSSYSNRLHRDMEYMVFGTEGKICFAFPTRGGRYYDFRNFGLSYALEPLIEKKKLQLILVDSIDSETWIAYDRVPHQRAALHEAWSEYVTHELLPVIRSMNSDPRKAMVVGCDLGAMHAANFLFRRPDQFDTLIGLSGTYTATEYFGDYTDDLISANSPDEFLIKMPMDHPWVRQYRKSNIILCAGQGLWEDASLESTHRLDEILTRMDIPHWADYWGYDVTHDWGWWKLQLAYFLDSIDL